MKRLSSMIVLGLLNGCLTGAALYKACAGLPRSRW